MKMTTLIAAFAAATMSTAAFAADVSRTNVPADSGSVPGFYVQGMGFFVEAGYEGRATVDATVLPAGVNSKEAGDVTAYLASIGVEAELVLRGKQTERETVVSLDDNGDEITTVIETTSRPVNGGW